MLWEVVWGRMGTIWVLPGCTGGDLKGRMGACGDDMGGCGAQSWGPLKDARGPRAVDKAAATIRQPRCQDVQRCAAMVWRDATGCDAM